MCRCLTGFPFNSWRKSRSSRRKQLASRLVQTPSSSKSPLFPRRRRNQLLVVFYVLLGAGPEWVPRTCCANKKFLPERTAALFPQTWPFALVGPSSTLKVSCVGAAVEQESWETAGLSVIATG